MIESIQVLESCFFEEVGELDSEALENLQSQFVELMAMVSTVQMLSNVALKASFNDGTMSAIDDGIKKIKEKLAEMQKILQEQSFSDDIVREKTVLILEIIGDLINKKFSKQP